MHGIAGEQHATVKEALRHKSDTRRPWRMAEDLHDNVVADAATHGVGDCRIIGW